MVRIEIEILEETATECAAAHVSDPLSPVQIGTLADLTKRLGRAPMWIEWKTFESILQRRINAAFAARAA